MQPFVRWIVSVGMTIVPISAYCQSTVQKIDIEFKNCLKQREASSTAGMRNCTAAAHKKMDDRLNEVYRQLMESLPGKQKELLRDSQRKWLAFREAELRFYEVSNPNAGGTLALVTNGGEAYEILKERVIVLERYLNH